MGAIRPQTGSDGLAKNEGALGGKHKHAWLRANGLSWEMRVQESRISRLENETGDKSPILPPGFTTHTHPPEPQLLGHQALSTPLSCSATFWTVNAFSIWI